MKTRKVEINYHIMPDGIDLITETDRWASVYRGSSDGTGWSMYVYRGTSNSFSIGSRFTDTQREADALAKKWVRTGILGKTK